MIIVIETIKTSMQDLSKEVGIQSREQVALEDTSMICLTSAVVA